MDVVVVVPGIMGTRLALPGRNGVADEEVWPPTVLETQLGYRRREKLADARVVPTTVIENIWCFDFYGPLFTLLGDIGYSESSNQRLVKFPYDWRRDLFATAERLASVLDGVHRDGARTITLVGHSMGGLICRLLLEGPSYRGRPWFGAIRTFIAIATPHVGAPLALARALGAEGAMGISKSDFAWLSSQEAYPSAYQLFPAPGEDACWDQASGDLRAIDIHQPVAGRLLGLNPTLLGRCAALHQTLSSGARPPHVRFFYFAAAGHRTATRVNVFEVGGRIDPARTIITRTEDAGDGTVPLYSALARAPQRHVATNEHASAFLGSPFRSVFFRLFGQDAGPAVEMHDGPTIKLSVESRSIQAGRDIEALLYPELPSADAAASFKVLGGDLVLRKVRDGEAVLSREVRRIAVAYEGPKLDRLRLALDPLEEPGHYELVFESENGSARTAFAVWGPSS